MFRTIFRLSIFLFPTFYGCASVQPIYIDTSPKVERVFKQNYQVGQAMNAMIGEAILKVQKYTLEASPTKWMSPTEDFKLEAALRNVNQQGYAAKNYRILGTTEIYGESFKVICLGEGYNCGFNHKILVNKEGQIYHKIMTHLDIYLVWNFEVIPQTVRFEEVIERKINMNEGYINHVLIYGGIDGNKLNFVYREFSPTNQFEPSLSKNLTYELGEESIQYCDLTIQIHEASSRMLNYTVLEDGIGLGD